MIEGSQGWFGFCILVFITMPMSLCFYIIIYDYLAFSYCGLSFWGSIRYCGCGCLVAAVVLRSLVVVVRSLRPVVQNMQNEQPKDNTTLR